MTTPPAGAFRRCGETPGVSHQVVLTGFRGSWRDATRQLLRPTSPEEMETYLKDESEKYAQLIRRLALPLH